jgi:hypothetical protein
MTRKGHDVTVKHEFIDERFERSARSFLHPTGHPWAALVLFDALLVCDPRMRLIICKCMNFY